MVLKCLHKGVGVGESRKEAKEAFEGYDLTSFLNHHMQGITDEMVLFNITRHILFIAAIKYAILAGSSSCSNLAIKRENAFI